MQIEKEMRGRKRSGVACARLQFMETLYLAVGCYKTDVQSLVKSQANPSKVFYSRGSVFGFETRKEKF